MFLSRKFKQPSITHDVHCFLQPYQDQLDSMGDTLSEIANVRFGSNFWNISIRLDSRVLEMSTVHRNLPGCQLELSWESVYRGLENLLDKCGIREIKICVGDRIRGCDNFENVQVAINRLAGVPPEPEEAPCLNCGSIDAWTDDREKVITMRWKPKVRRLLGREESMEPVNLKFCHTCGTEFPKPKPKRPLAFW